MIFRLTCIALASLIYSFIANAGQVALTIDDPFTSDTVRLTGKQRDHAIRSALADAHIKATLFVCGMRIDSPDGKVLLKNWDHGGHTIANHTYSHHYLHGHNITPEIFIADIIKVEPLISGLKNFQKLFRFPYLKEGDTLEKRDAVRAFLSNKGYRQGAVTIDTSDWYISDRLIKKLQKDPTANTDAYRDFYLKHIWDRT